MRMTMKDYDNMVKGFERLEPIAVKQYGSLEKYYKAVWRYACKVGKVPEVRYVWDCFWNARIYFGKMPMQAPYYNVITDNEYNDSHLATAVKRYLKDKGFDYYDK